MESSPSSSSSSLSSPLISNPVPSSSSRARESRHRKKKMKTHQSLSTSQIPNDDTLDNHTSKISWKSETTQQIYSNKLLHALRHVRLTHPSPSPAAHGRGRAVREAADRVLAMAARGRTRWSRAILSNRLRLKFMNKRHKRQRAAVTGASRSPKKLRVEVLSLKGKNVPAVQRKVKTLARLVPGCRKEALPVILEEATDYIPALEMQVRALRDILSRLSALRTAGEGSTSGPPPPENGLA